MSKNPKIESSQGSNIIIQEDDKDVEVQEIPPHELVYTMHNFYTIEEIREKIEGNTGTQGDSSPNIISHYNTMKLQTTKSILEKSSQDRGKAKNKLVVLFAPSHDNNVFNLVVLEPKVKKLNTTQDYKASQGKIKLDQVCVVDKVHLHKQIGKVIFLDLIQSIVHITKFKA